DLGDEFVARALSRLNEFPRDDAFLNLARARVAGNFFRGIVVAPGHDDRRRRMLRPRSEEHTSELQSQSNLVCRLLLEKKKTKFDRPARLPGPQRDALRVSYGRQYGSAARRFMVAVTDLIFLHLAAEEEPILCLVDDV